MNDFCDSLQRWWREENDQNKNLNIEIVDLIIESPQIYEISTTVRKKFDKKPIQKKQVEYLIQDANEQILSSNKNLNIIHILVDNYYIDEGSPLWGVLRWYDFWAWK